MSEYYLYSHKKRYKNNLSDKRMSDNKTERITFRVPASLLNKIKDKEVETGKNRSELTRLLWENYFTKERDFNWQKEVVNW